MIRYFFILILFVFCSYNQGYAKSKSVKLKDAYFSFSLMDVSSGQILESQKEKRLMHPASVVKIFSFATYLKKLGPDYIPKTKIYLEDFDPASGENKGAFVIEGSYDPALVYEDLYAVFDYFRSMGLKKQSGPFIISVDKVDLGLPSGFRPDKNFRAYAAESLGFNINYNSMAVVAPFIKDRPRPFFLPKEVGGLSLSSDLKASKRTSMRLSPVLNKKQKGFKVSGKSKRSFEDKRFYRRLMNPKKAHCELVLSMAGFLFDTGSSSCSWRENYKIKNKDLALEWGGNDLAYGSKLGLKYSQNFMTESYSLILAKESGKRVSWASANRLLLSELAKNIDGRFTMPNASGLGKGHGFSTNQVVGFLRSTYDDFEISSNFLAALPVYGVDGTLKRRKSALLKKNVIAKTGSLKGVVSLAGYIKTKSGRLLAFSIIANKWNQSIYKAFALQDRKLEYWWKKY